MKVSVAWQLAHGEDKDVLGGIISLPVQTSAHGLTYLIENLFQKEHMFFASAYLTSAANFTTEVIQLFNVRKIILGGSWIFVHFSSHFEKVVLQV